MTLRIGIGWTLALLCVGAGCSRDEPSAEDAGAVVTDVPDVPDAPDVPSGDVGEVPTPLLIITPTAPNTTHNLVANVDPEEAVISWRRDGQATDIVGRTVKAGWTARGQVWEATAQVGGGPTGTATVTIGNAPPRCTQASVSLTDVIACRCEVRDDPDPGDPALDRCQITVDGVPQAPGCEIDASALSSGQAIACELTPSDGLDDGDPVVSPAIPVPNQAPSLPGAAILPGEADVTTSLTCQATGEVTDPDGDATALSVTWHVGEHVSPQTTETVVAGALERAPGEAARKGDAVHCVLTASDGALSSAPAQSPAVTLNNAPPTGGSVTLTPAAATVATALSCEAAGATDPDGDPLTWSYRWWVNGILVAPNGPTLSGPVKGDGVRCEASASDGQASSAWSASNEVVIQNTPPSLASATVSPAEAPRSGSFTCTAHGWSDPDLADAPDVTLEWWVGGVPVGLGATLAAAALLPGDAVICRATPHDGEAAGPPVESAPATVFNQLPVAHAALIQPPNPTTADALACDAVLADADGDAVSVMVDWTVDGAPVADPSGAARGQVVACTLTPHDGFDSGVAVQAAAIIENAAPTAAAPGVAPASAEAGVPRTCVLGEVDDADGDPVTTMWAWLVNGAVLPGATGPVIDGTTLSPGDVVRCRVVLSDGQDQITLLSAPAAVTAGTCLPGTCDDGDPCTDDTCGPAGCEYLAIPGCQDCLIDADCLGADRCLTGRCDDGLCAFAPRTCYDGLRCTADECDPDRGCAFRLMKGCEAGCLSDAECDDGAPCTEDRCVDEACIQTLLACDDHDPCTRDFCDPESGECTAAPWPACDDGGGTCEIDADCAVGGACRWATCVGPPEDRRCLLEQITCNDYDSCTADDCDPGIGCVAPKVSPGCAASSCATAADCEDDDACTGEACVDQACATTCLSHADCDDGDPETLDSCVAGRCTWALGIACAADADCRDGNACTTNRCEAGVCRTRPVLCDDLLPCTLDRVSCGALPSALAPYPVAAGCDPAVGQVPACDPSMGCLHLPRLDCGASWQQGQPSLTVACAIDPDCDTGHPCAPGACVDGACVVTPVVCPDPGPGAQAYCDPQTGQCKVVQRPGWEGCDTDADCRVAEGLTGLDHCTIGYCDLGAAEPECLYVQKRCDDQDPCTLDTCSAQLGCVFTPIPNCQGCQADAACEDYDHCTVDECVAGTCVHHPLPGCDSCVNATCGVGGDPLACACPAPDPPAMCPAAYCVHDVDCADGLTCTLDRCLSNGECTHSPVKCTYTQPCLSPFGECVEGAGCRPIPDGDCERPCDSAADCVTGLPCFPPACVDGDCVAEGPKCDDGDPCTADVCDPDTGECAHLPDPGCLAACESDADCPAESFAACAPPWCLGGACHYVPVTCSDFDPCTADACTASGCVFTPIAGCTGCTADAQCDDGQACTAGRCDDGRCKFDPIEGCASCAADTDCPPPAEQCQFSRCVAGLCTVDEEPNCTVCDPAAPQIMIDDWCEDGLNCTVHTCDAIDMVCRQQWDENIPGCVLKDCDSHHDCAALSPCDLQRCAFELEEPVCQHLDVFSREVPFDTCPLDCTRDLDCVDDDPCTLDRCLDSGQCQWTPKDCVDGLACTVDHACGPGGCEMLPDPACAAACETDAECAVGDGCAVGACVAGACVVDTSACPQCLTDAECAGGACQPARCLQGACVTAPGGCDDSNPCTADLCDPALGCVYEPDPACPADCVDDADCDDDDVQTEDRCDVQLARCENLFRPPCTRDADCYDEDACSFERCTGDGRCSSTPVMCYDDAPCTKDLAPCGGALSDISTNIAYPTCIPEDGQRVACHPEVGCYHMPVLQCGQQLADGKIKTVECETDADCASGHKCYPGSCHEGVCHTSRVECPNPGPNKQAFCDWQTGACTVVDFPGWTGCTKHADCRYLSPPGYDGDIENVRDGYDRCSLGFCDLGSTNKQCMYFEKKCNDMNPCTQDSCSLTEGCVFAPIEGCEGCQTDADCADFDPCTTDTCDPETHNCSNVAAPGCTACTIETAGQRCDDGNECTRDVCDMIETGRLPNEPGHCVHEVYTVDEKPWCFGACTGDADCDDGSPCTLDRCRQDLGLCDFVPVTCDDDQPCSQDPPCDPDFGCEPELASACMNKPCTTQADCAGGDACLYFDCVQGACTPKVTPCDDNNPNTLNTCHGAAGACSTLPGPGPACQSTTQCDDDDACTIDECLNFGPISVCYLKPVQCNDFDPCTADTCDPTTGCQFAPIPACVGCTTDLDCHDGNACTQDTCGEEDPHQCTNTPWPPGQKPKGCG